MVLFKRCYWLRTRWGKFAEKNYEKCYWSDAPVFNISQKRANPSSEIFQKTNVTRYYRITTNRCKNNILRARLVGNDCVVGQFSNSVIMNVPRNYRVHVTAYALCQTAQNRKCSAARACLSIIAALCRRCRVFIFFFLTINVARISQQPSWPDGAES